jgi:hypothetical protein
LPKGNANEKYKEKYQFTIFKVLLKCIFLEKATLFLQMVNHLTTRYLLSFVVDVNQEKFLKLQSESLHEFAVLEI